MSACSSSCRAALGAVLLLACSASAQVGAPPLQFATDGTGVCFSPWRVDTPSAGFSLLNTSGSCGLDLSGNVTMAGPYVGDEADEVIFFPGGTTDQTCGTGNAGRHRVLDNGRLQWCDGAGSTRVYSIDGPPLVIAGGLGTTAFTYAGEVSTWSSADTGCSRTVCRCGTCTGTEGSGLCTLPLTSNLGASAMSAVFGVPVLDSAVYEFSSVVISAGTVTIANATSVVGNTLALRVTGDVAVTGTGAITLKGLGQPWGNFANADCAGAAFAGEAGLQSAYLLGGAGGPNTGADTAGAGQSASSIGFAPTSWLGLSRRFIGTCGGARTQSSFAMPPLTGLATGGGAGGCTSACASGKVGQGGAGGGFLYIETRGTYTCSSSATRAIDLRGNDGQGGATGCTGGVACQAGGGGGGGGSLTVLTKIVGTNTCTVSATGGAGGVANHANCGDGATGGTGAAFVRLIPG